MRAKEGSGIGVAVVAANVLMWAFLLGGCAASIYGFLQVWQWNQPGMANVGLGVVLLIAACLVLSFLVQPLEIKYRQFKDRHYQ